MLTHKKTILLLLLISSFILTSADLTTFKPLSDVGITSYSPTQSIHGVESVNVSWAPQGEVRYLVGFSFESIPKYSVVKSANLTLTLVNNTAPLDLELWKVSGKPDVICTSWTMITCSSEWTKEGGDLIELVDVTTLDKVMDKVTFDVTPFVQDLVNGEEEGWLLVKVRENMTGWAVINTEISPNPPVITVIYEKPVIAAHSKVKEIRMAQGEEVKFKVIVDGVLSLPVRLELESPVELNYSFEPPEGLPPFNSTLSIGVPESTPAGRYELRVLAKGPSPELSSNFTVNLTIIESVGIVVKAPEELELHGGEEKVVKVQVLPKGGYQDNVFITIKESPEWLFVFLEPNLGKPPFNVTLKLRPLPGTNGTGVVVLQFSGQGVLTSKELKVRTTPRRVAVYSNSIDWNLTREAIISASNETGVTVHRLTEPEFEGYDLVLLMGGPLAPTDDWMPVNVVRNLLPQEKVDELMKVGWIVYWTNYQGAKAVVIAGKDRYMTSRVLTMDLDGDGVPLVLELIRGTSG